MQNIREKLKRKLSMNDKNANFDEHEDADNETTGHLSREIDAAEQENHPQGKPGSFLNRMISHGNKKTEDQIAEEQKRGGSSQGLSNAGQTTQGQQALSSGTNQNDGVIR